MRPVDRRWSYSESYLVPPTRKLLKRKRDLPNSLVLTKQITQWFIERIASYLSELYHFQADGQEEKTTLKPLATAPGEVPHSCSSVGTEDQMVSESWDTYRWLQTLNAYLFIASIDYWLVCLAIWSQAGEYIRPNWSSCGSPTCMEEKEWGRCQWARGKWTGAFGRFW